MDDDARRRATGHSQDGTPRRAHPAENKEETCSPLDPSRRARPRLSTGTRDERRTTRSIERSIPDHRSISPGIRFFLIVSRSRTIRTIPRMMTTTNDGRVLDDDETDDDADVLFPCALTDASRSKPAESAGRAPSRARTTTSTSS